MPRHGHVIRRSTAVVRSSRVMQVEGMFDLPKADKSEVKFSVRLPLEERDWSIGLIHGPSGCGKTTIARELFHREITRQYDWGDGTRSILDFFPESLSIKDVTGLLSSVGFSSPPAWLRPFACLSNGEQFRVHVARAMAESDGLAVIDEFTSVVDRTVAKIGSAAIAKAIRKRPGKRLICIACQDDIIDWLQPDWTFQPATGQFAWRSLQRRPEITIKLFRANRTHWRSFHHHHYLSADLNQAAEFWLATVEDRPAACVAVLNMTHASGPMRREHRCVCLPDFQGVGIGNAVSETVAAIYAGLGHRYVSLTSHPAMIGHRSRSRNWECTRKASLQNAPHTGLMRRTGKPVLDSFGRITASFRWVGRPMDSALAKSAHDVSLLRWIRAKPNCTHKILIRLSGVTESQAVRYLETAVKAGIVLRSGTGRGFNQYTYRVHPSFRSSEPLERVDDAD